jgi:hypothetical protein
MRMQSRTRLVLVATVALCLLSLVACAFAAGGGHSGGGKAKKPKPGAKIEAQAKEKKAEQIQTNEQKAQGGSTSAASNGDDVIVDKADGNETNEGGAHSPSADPPRRDGSPKTGSAVASRNDEQVVELLPDLTESIHVSKAKPATLVLSLEKDAEYELEERSESPLVSLKGTKGIEVLHSAPTNGGSVTTFKSTITGKLSVLVKSSATKDQKFDVTLRKTVRATRGGETPLVEGNRQVVPVGKVVPVALAVKLEEGKEYEIVEESNEPFIDFTSVSSDEITVTEKQRRSSEGKWVTRFTSLVTGNVKLPIRVRPDGSKQVYVTIKKVEPTDPPSSPSTLSTLHIAIGLVSLIVLIAIVAAIVVTVRVRKDEDSGVRPWPSKSAGPPTVSAASKPAPHVSRVDELTSRVNAIEGAMIAALAEHDGRLADIEEAIRRFLQPAGAGSRDYAPNHLPKASPSALPDAPRNGDSLHADIRTTTLVFPSQASRLHMAIESQGLKTSGAKASFHDPNALLETGAGEQSPFVVVSPSNGGGDFYALPGLTRLSDRQEYYSYYQALYACSKVGVGEITVQKPAIVVRSEKGWALRVKGEIDVSS